MQILYYNILNYEKKIGIDDKILNKKNTSLYIDFKKLFINIFIEKVINNSLMIIFLFSKNLYI